MIRDQAEILDRLTRLDLVSAFDNKRVIITGSRGFLGQAFVRTFAALGSDVVAIDRYALASELGAAPPVQLRNVEHVDWDVTKSDFPVHGAVHYILSLAAIASPIHYARRPLDCFDVIVNGTRHMAELAARKGATMLLSSTSELYGNPPPSSLEGAFGGSTENQLAVLDPWRTVRARAYDVPKLASEALAAIFSDANVNMRTVRYFNIFGQGLVRGDFRVMSKFAASVVDGKPITVFGGGFQTRSFCYLTDAVVGSVLALVKGDSAPYNVGNPAFECSMSELAEIFARIGNQITGKTIEVISVTPPDAYAHEPRRRRPNIARLSKLGFTPRIGVEEGVRRFLTWTLEHY